MRCCHILLALGGVASVLAGTIPLKGGDVVAVDNIPSPTKPIPTASPVPETNMERLQRGLPPLPPTRARQRREFVPRPSCNSIVTVSGYIGVYRVSDDTLVGYLQRQTTKGFWYYGGLTAASVEPNVFSGAGTFTIPANPCEQFVDITIDVPPPGDRYNLLGIAGAYGDRLDFSEGHVGFGFIASAGHVPAGSPPSMAVGNGLRNVISIDMPTESQVWTIGPDYQLVPTWTNVDGTQHPANIIYASRGSDMKFVGDKEVTQASYTSITPYEYVVWRLIPTQAKA